MIGKNERKICKRFTFLNLQRKTIAKRKDKAAGKIMAGLVPITISIAKQITI
jgi:hypothetical protein